MNTILLVLLGTFMATSGAPKQQAAGKAPAQDQWLSQLNGVWDATSEMTMAPGAAPMKATATEKVRMVGVWSISEQQVKVGGMSVTGIMTVAYDQETKKFKGTWIDSATDYMWRYEGTLDSTGKKLTLEAEGPSFTAPGKMAKFRDAIEMRSKDHKVFTSSILGDDGKWFTFQTAHARRKNSAK